ncbi:MAG: hypothetical protein VX951_10785 [Planctomycetota bacterium]|nr:hypothetical protein [Planctomycetota bacterium]
MSCSKIAASVALMVMATTTNRAQTPHTHAVASKPAASKSVKLDALSRRAFARWHALEYHLGRAGVKQLHMKIKATSKSTQGSIATDGSYSHDGKQGKLQWKDPKLGTMLAERGWDARAFDRWLSKRGLLDTFGTAHLTASKDKDGVVTVKINGKTRSGYTSLTFDAVGRLAWLTLALPATNAKSKPGQLRINMQHRSVGELVLITGWKFQMKSESGTVTGETRLSYKTLGKHHVVEKAEETLLVDKKPFGTQTLTFSNHAIDSPPPANEKPGKKTPEETQQRGE